LTRDICIERFAYSERFRNELRSLKPDLIKAVKEALDLLKRNPRAKSLRLHPLTGLPKPTVWKIDVLPNHSWQVTFELNGTTAELKRIGTHKSIDRDPR
jgi:mRNA-degrading endonuclease YafQ of YafQ-DinJ toxin-antitoxin module